MLRTQLAAAVAVAALMATPAAAAGYIYFDIQGSWLILDQAMPYGLGPNPTLHGRITYNTDSWEPVWTGQVDYKDITSFYLETPTKTFTLADLDPESFVRASEPGGTVDRWFMLMNNFPSPNAAHITFFQENQTFLYDLTNSAACPEACMTVLYADSGVPEPATWAMMILGLGLVGATLRRQPQIARFQP